MSKSVLVIDTPENCYRCTLSRMFGMDGAIECEAVKQMGVNHDGKTMPDWCPLEEISQKKAEERQLECRNSRGSMSAYRKETDKHAVSSNPSKEEVLMEWCKRGGGIG